MTSERESATVTRALGEFEMMLLFAVLRLDGDAYGAAVLREIEERTGREVAQGAVYTGLDRLEARGLLVSRIERPEESRPGRPRRYFRLEPAGAEALSRSMDALDRIASGMRGELAARLSSGDS